MAGIVRQPDRTGIADCSDWRGFAPLGIAGPDHPVGRDPCGRGSETGRRTLVLPDAGSDDGARPTADGPFDRIAIHRFTEAFGSVEAFTAQLAAQLAPDGVLVFECANLRAGSRLLALLRDAPGAPGELLPGADVPLPVERIHDALVRAGLVVCDVAAAGGSESGDVLRPLRAHGLCLGPAEPERFRLLARRVRATAGSVLVAAAAEANRRAIAAALRPSVPRNWEIVVGQGADPVAAFGDALGSSTGEMLWLLQERSAVPPQAFDALREAAEDGPVRPEGTDGQLDGLMLARRDLLLTGAFDAGYEDPGVAIEDWLLRLERRVRPPRSITVPGFAPAPAPRVVPEVRARDRDRLLQRWDPEHRSGPRIELRDPPRVSLCMIVRDEERFLDACLRRAAPAVDEVVVVDTGSRDASRAIAAAHGARVVQRPWTDDFAAARNASLEAATHDWVLVLDADEMLADGSAPAIRAATRRRDVAGFQVRLRNFDDAGEVTSEVLLLRLFRRLPDLRYRNRIHEQLDPPIGVAGARYGLGVAAAGQVVIEHHGYADGVWHTREKERRNERLFLMQLEERPDDAYSLFMYGDFLRRRTTREADAQAALGAALDILMRAPRHIAREWPFAGQVAAACAVDRVRRDDLAGAQRICTAALERFFASPDLCWIAAQVALRLRRPAEAIPLLERCLSFRNRVLAVPVQRGITGAAAHLALAEARALLGDVARARLHLERARRLEPDDDATALGLVRLHLRDQDVPGALGELAHWLRKRPTSAPACREAAALLRALGREPAAERLAARAERLTAHRVPIGQPG